VVLGDDEHGQVSAEVRELGRELRRRKRTHPTVLW
jgi:hypothetical protein